ncbi:MAG: ABC-2 transporter permease, partial [Clostridia bacterium]|nr:ABC-2 transporter permease [Clostridia bacterium]
MKAVYKREMLSYFTTMTGYVFVGVFMFLSSLFFSMEMFRNRTGSVTGIMPMCMVILMLLMPIITMRLIAEDKVNKTDQLLLTAPVKVSNIVLGKYFAAFTVFLIATATTLVYVLVVAVWGEVLTGETFASYLGYI